MAIENTTTVKAVTSGTQLSSVGTVKTVVGLVKAVDTNGVERVLQVGDKVYANETIITSADGGVIVEFQNGSFLDLPRSAHIMLDPEIYSANAAKSIEQEASDEAARIARAIAEGRDPNAEAAPAAAGGETGDEGTTTPLVIDFDNTQGNVNSGYPTGPISLAFPPMQEELPPVPETTAAIIQTPPTVDVTPPVYVPPGQTPPPNTAVDGIVSPGQVFEEGLDQAGDDNDGTNKDTDAEIALGGTIIITDAEGLADIASITIGGEVFAIGGGGLAALVGEEIAGANGTLKITAYDGNGTFTYSYTLTSNTTDGTGDETDTFGVTVTDQAGLSASTSIVITIIDDVPIINITDEPTVSALSVIEASGSGEGNEATATITPPVFTYLAGADGLDTVTTTYALTLAGGTATSLVTTDGNHPITLVVDSANQISGQYDSDGDTVLDATAFTVTLSGTTVTLVSNVALEHDNTQDGSEDNDLDISTLINVTATITVTDNDGDVVSTNVSTTGPLSLTFNDTDPAITNVVAPTLSALAVVEASGVGGQATATITAPTYTATAVDGSDGGVVSYALTLAGGTATGLVTTAGGFPITLSVSGDGQTVTGLYNGSNVAFTVTLSGSTVTFTSNVALEHDNTQGGAEDNTLDISSLINVTATITVTDNDGDVVSTNVSTTGPLSLEFGDTDPASLTPTAIHMIDLATSPAITENLHFATGADGVQTVRFTITDGAPAYEAGTTTQLSFNGQPLYLHYGQTAGVIDYTILVATTSSALAPTGVPTTSSTVAYWIDIDPVANTYTMHSNGVISNGSETTATDLSSVGGGNVEAKAITDIGDTTQDVLLTTKPGLSVNTNANVIGIGAGQSFTTTDGIRIDFTNGTVTGNGGNAVYTTDGSHNLTTTFKQEISLTAGASKADITIKAILAEAIDDGVYYGDAAGESSVSITGVRVYIGTLAQVQAGTATEVLDDTSVGGILLDYDINPDGTVSITGLQDGWTFVIETTNSFSALQIDSQDTTGNYKLGSFSYGESSAGDPVDLSYNITGVDGDGDTVTGTIEATLYPASATQSGLNDGTPDDTLTGTDGIDYLLGNLGDDILSGLGGDDVLVGGVGTDTLTGGLGADRFVLTNGDGPDIITDFTVAQGDILDISDVLAGAEITAAEFFASPGSFLSFVQSGTDTNVVLDLDGAVGGTTQVIATLEDVSAATLNIETLIGSGQIDYTP
jgi:hypothetical protein